LIGDYVIRKCDLTATGPFDLRNNVISNANSSWSEGAVSNFITYQDPPNHCTVVQMDNLTSTNASSLVDANNDYKLIPGQAHHVGARGWQLDDGLSPMDLRSATTLPALPPSDVRVQ
jgi:hypothetical protein